ncbi:RNA polymerase II elongation factor ELL-like [Zophobas morio]|uniref:RNA polymerase II elongation factor ELL-like n=1 Tax=Zophobas morio TaxID=2755281 RepID=UPI0030834538
MSRRVSKVSRTVSRVSPVDSRVAPTVSRVSPFTMERLKGNVFICRRKSQNLTSSDSSDGGSSGSSQSPTSTHPGSPPPTTTSSFKRPGYYDNPDGFPTKRQRISHYRKPSEQTTYRSPVENNSQRRLVTDSWDCRNGSPQAGKTDSGYENGAPVSPVPVKSGAVDSSSEFPDYLTKYSRIKDAEQRRRFEADFNADFAEYKDLYKIVDKVSRRFVSFESMLKQEDASSPRFQALKMQIVREYNENKKDLEHQKLKRRFHYLHDKLSHIKRLVLEPQAPAHCYGLLPSDAQY